METIKKYIETLDYKKIWNNNRPEILWLVVCIAFLIFITNISGVAYIGGVSQTVKGYIENENEELVYSADIPRGAVVRKESSYRDKDDEKLRLVEYNNSDYYVNKDNLFKTAHGLVKEEDVYVRTPLTVYANEDDPTIATAMKKGSKMHVLDYDELLPTGAVNKYKVEYTDSLGESGEGYIYGKYVVGTEEEANEVYNFNGEQKMAKKAKFWYNLHGGKATHLDYFPYEKTEIEGNEFCGDARTMYINTYAALHPEEYLKVIKDTDCNAVCIDIKDGQLTYKSEVAKEVSPHAYKEAYASAEEFQKCVQEYRDAGVYTIGRIVVFNDTRYAKDHPEHCIKSKLMTKKWPSAYCREVWEYNVRLAQEAVELCGFNEIQFDYVRFPESSYELSESGKADFRNKYDEEKCQAIQGFCYYAADQLREVGAYISIDVFGESTYGYVTAYGQFWSAMSNIVDALSAMPYTDHTGGDGAWNRPYQTVYNWAKTAKKSQKHISHPAVARTWITGYDTPYWNTSVTADEKYLREQIRGLNKADMNGGFIPWNVGSDIGKYRLYKNIWNEK